MANELREQVRAKAEELLAEDSDGANVIAVDRKPVVFAAIEDVERVATLTTEDDFLACIDDAATAEYAGWDLDRVRDHRGRHAPGAKRYPFELSEVYPWWDMLPKA